MQQQNDKLVIDNSEPMPFVVIFLLIILPILFALETVLSAAWDAHSEASLRCDNLGAATLHCSYQRVTPLAYFNLYQEVRSAEVPQLIQDDEDSDLSGIWFGDVRLLQEEAWLAELFYEQLKQARNGSQGTYREFSSTLGERGFGYYLMFAVFILLWSVFGLVMYFSPGTQYAFDVQGQTMSQQIYSRSEKILKSHDIDFADIAAVVAVQGESWGRGDDEDLSKAEYVMCFHHKLELQLKPDSAHPEKVIILQELDCDISRYPDNCENESWTAWGSINRAAELLSEHLGIPMLTRLENESKERAQEQERAKAEIRAKAEARQAELKAQAEAEAQAAQSPRPKQLTPEQIQQIQASVKARVATKERAQANTKSAAQAVQHNANTATNSPPHTAKTRPSPNANPAADTDS